MRIKSIKARNVLNAHGIPTVEVEVATLRFSASSSIPLAASKSKYEFRDLYDDKRNHFLKEFYESVVDVVERIIAPAFEGKNSMNQEEIDRNLVELDGTIDRSRLGVNLITALSQAIAKVGAMESELPLFKYIRVLHDYSGSSSVKLNSAYTLPKPVITIFKASSHNLNESLPVQEIFVIPRGDFSYTQGIVPLFQQLAKSQISSKSNDSMKALIARVYKTIAKSKLKLDLGFDMAASRFKRNDGECYVIPNFNTSKIPFSGDFVKLKDIYKKWIKEFKLVFIEDPFAEDDYSAWKEFLDIAEDLNPSIQVVSDDFTATNIERLEKIGVLENTNNVVIKPTQIGTVTESIHFAQRARVFGHNITLSYRHGETEDTFISDFAVGVNAEFIRTGGCRGSEHLSKINRLICIEDSVK